MILHSGPIVTCVHDLQQIDLVKRAGNYKGIKVVTSWGLYNKPWEDSERKYILDTFDTVVVRTMHGDPSLPYEQHFLIPELTLAEIAPWYKLRKDICIELGNEPNVGWRGNNSFYWVYRYWLIETLKKIKRVFPYATIITPAPSLTHNNAEDYITIVGDVLQEGHYIGLHAYEHYSFQNPGTHQLEQAKLYAKRLKMPFIFTEIGINDYQTSAYNKGYEYGLLSRKHPVFYYHIDTSQVIQPQYHISVMGDKGFYHGFYGYKQQES